MVILQNPAFELQWGEHEAPPGHFIARERSAAEMAATWLPARQSRSFAPPNANDIAAFPPLQQGSDGKFVMGRTISFAGAAAAGGPAAERPHSARQPGGVRRERSEPVRRPSSARRQTTSASAGPPVSRRSSDAGSSGGASSAASASATPPQTSPPSRRSTPSYEFHHLPVTPPATTTPPPATTPPTAATPPPPAAARRVSSEADYVALADGDVDDVCEWISAMGLGAYVPSFRQHCVNGKLLRSLSEEEMETELGIASRMHRRRLQVELDALRAAAPPPAPGPVRQPSEPAQWEWRLEEVRDSLELKQVREHVERSIRLRDEERTESVRVSRVERVHNEKLRYRFNHTASSLLEPRENRAVPPQGGYFHGTTLEGAHGICAHGFDDRRWNGGKYGRGQYLSADASRAAPRKYTQESNMLLLVEAVLGRPWHLPARESRKELAYADVRAAGYDSVAVTESEEVVVYLRYQAMPRYLIHFERVEQTPGGPGRALGGAVGGFAGGFRLHDGRYALPPACPTLSWAEPRSEAYDHQRSRPVFLKLVRAETSAREKAALAAVGAAFAPELYGSFAHLDGEVLVMEMAHPAAPGERASLESICRRRRASHGGSLDALGAAAAHAGGADADAHAVLFGGGGGGGGGGDTRFAAGGADDGDGEESGAADCAMMLAAIGKRVLQVVAAVHAAGWVHCDVKPEHFMRFGKIGEWKLVDFGSAHRAGERADHVAHSKRYCPPEVATAMVRGNGRAAMCVAPSLDVWASALVLYELFHGAPLLPADVDYTAIVGGVRLPAASLTDAQLRLLQGALAPDAAGGRRRSICSRSTSSGRRRTRSSASASRSPPSSPTRAATSS